MGKRNDKKVIRETRDLLALVLGNFLESERQRRYAHKSKPGPKTRKTFCNKFGLVESTVGFIESERMLKLKLSQMRTYLAALRGEDDVKLLESLKKVYDGLKEIDAFLHRF